MRNEDLMALAIAGIAVWMLLKSRPAVAMPVATRVVPTDIVGPAPRTVYYTALPWINPTGFGGPGGAMRDYLATDANGVSILP